MRPQFSLLAALSFGIATSRLVAGPGANMEYAPILSCSLEAPKGEQGFAPARAPGGGNPSVAMKAVVVRLGPHDEANVAFDTDLLRMAVGWTGGFMDFHWTNIANDKGDRTGAPVITGNIKFKTPELPGWIAGDDLTDPRKHKAGPLPKEKGHYHGLFLNGSRVVFMYEALGREVLESPELSEMNGEPVFERHFTVGPSTKTTSVVVAGSNDGAANWTVRHTANNGSGMAMPIKKSDGRMQIVTVIGDFQGLAIHGGPNEPVRVSVPPTTAKQSSFEVALLEVSTQDEAAKYLANWKSEGDLTALCHGGAKRWSEEITLSGTTGGDNEAYVVDTIPLPDQNPWGAWMRISGFDFYPDGRAAVCTFNGDVWIVSGIDDKLDHVTWKRYAAGLYEPLGLKIIDGKVFVLGRDRITRLTDSNNDGEADFYESFNSDRTLYPSYHAFAFDLQTDSKGNIYFVSGGNQIGQDRPGYATVMKISHDGTKSETVGDGFRAPNGMEIGPHDEIAVSDNQGHWIPSSKISLVKPGGFYGHVADPRVDSKASIPASYDEPLLWIPYTMDNSSGGGTWAPSGTKWGPYAEHLLHTSYGFSSLFAVMDETVGDTKQAGIVKFPLKFLSGIMRARFNPADGQLYVCGLKGWQTNGAKYGCFQRVRYTGKPLYMPTGMHVLSNKTIAITFDVPLDKTTAADPHNFDIQQWNYKWWSTYGSPEFSLAHPGQKGKDTVEITGAKLSPDGKTVTLTTAPLRKVQQMDIKMQIKAADGGDVHVEIGNTINKVPGQDS